MQVIYVILNNLVTKEVEKYEINFTVYSVLCNISFQHVISINKINAKMISKIVYILFFLVSLWNLVFDIVHLNLNVRLL